MCPLAALRPQDLRARLTPLREAVPLVAPRVGLLEDHPQDRQANPARVAPVAVPADRVVGELRAGAAVLAAAPLGIPQVAVCRRGLTGCRRICRSASRR